MAEPHLVEKQETDDTVQYFKDFLFDDKNKDAINMLRSVVREFRNGLGNTNVLFVRVTGANASMFASFKKATVECEVYRSESTESVPVVAPFALFFLRGYLTLAEFVHKKRPKLPTNQLEQLALKDLLQFLTNTRDKSVLTANNTKEKTELEAALAVRVAQHLLVPLAPHKTFVIDCYPGLQLKGCCPEEHPIDGNKGDTSFGCHKGWHGRADILLMGDDIPLTVVDQLEDAGDLETISVSSDASVEVKKGEDFNSESISQITAQTIVYSFVQNRKNPKSPNSLVPGIGICAKKLVINLYDCVEDILVSTGPIDIYAIYAGSNLNVKAIVMLWLALNHGLFGNKTPEKYQNYTAKFHDVIGPEHLEAYKNESEQPFIAKSEERYLSKFMQDLNLNRSDGLEDVTDHITEKTHPSFLLK